MWLHTLQLIGIPKMLSNHCEYITPTMSVSPKWRAVNLCT